MKKRRYKVRPWARLRLYGAVALFMCVLVAGCLLYLRPKPVASNPPPPPSSRDYVLKLNGPITAASAGVLVALSDGLFQRSGLSVRLEAGTSDEDATSSVVAHDNTIGLATAQGFLKARAEGAPIVAFAAASIVSSVEFFALSGTQLLRPADLEGKRIGYKPELDNTTILNAFIAGNRVSQSGIRLMETNRGVSDLLDGRIDILVGHRDVEGELLENAKASYRSLSPASFGVHSMGPVYFANERAFSSRGNFENFVIAISDGWNAIYSDYGRTTPMVARSIEAELSSTSIGVNRFVDAHRRFMRPYGTRFGELDTQRFNAVQEQLLRQRIIQRPADLARAINLDILREAYRTKPDRFSRTEP